MVIHNFFLFLKRYLKVAQKYCLDNLFLKQNRPKAVDVVALIVYL